MWKFLSRRRDGKDAAAQSKPRAFMQRLQQLPNQWVEPCKRCYRVMRPFFVEKETRVKAFAYLAGLVVLIWVSGKLNVEISRALGHYMTALGDHPIKGEDGYVTVWLIDLLTYMGSSGRWLWIFIFLILLAIIDPVQVICNAMQTKLSVDWRKFLSEKYLTGQFKRMVGYVMERYGKIDNPDQRIADNIRDFTWICVALFIAVVQGLINMLVWTPELWHLSHELTYLVYGWAVVVSVLSAIIGKPLVRLSYTYNEREADFRFTLQEARREAEAIAYAQAEEMTRQQASSRLGLVVDMQIAVMKRNIFVQAFTTYANGVVPWMAPVLLAPLFVLHGSGVIFEAQLGVTMLFGALAVVVNQFGSITSGLAVADRLDSLRQAQEDYAKQPIPEGGIAITDGADLVFQKLILKSFDGKTDLIKIGPEGVEGLDMVIKKGESLCVLGDDAMAKTEFVRLLNRLTKSGQGLVTLPSREDMSFLLETPFLPPVSLREAVTGDPKKVDDEEVLKVLRLVGLATLRKRVGGLDTPVNWGKELKSNELQRLSFARAVFSKHSYVVIDGGMSALNTKTTQLFYGMLSSRPDTTVVSVAASSTAAKYHKWVLVLNVEKPWELHTFTDFERIEQERKAAEAQKNAGKTPSKWVINLPVLGRWEFQNVIDSDPAEVVPPEAANNNGGGK